MQNSFSLRKDSVYLINFRSAPISHGDVINPLKFFNGQGEKGITGKDSVSVITAQLTCFLG